MTIFTATRKIVLFTALFLITCTSCSKEADRYTFPEVDASSCPADAKWDFASAGYVGVENTAGKMYADNSYYCCSGGRNYVVINRCVEMPVAMSYDEIMSLQPGDVIRIDRDNSTSVDYLIEEQEYARETHVFTDSPEHYITAESGRINISDDYCFIHPEYEHFPDGSLNFSYGENNSKLDKDLWVLCDGNGKNKFAYELNVIEVFDDLQWIPIADDCVITIWDDDMRFEEYQVTTAELIDNLTSIHEQYGVVWFSASAKIDECGEIYDLQMATWVY